MRILLALQYPGYLRYFDSALRELVRRGHVVHLLFEKPSKQAEGLEAVEDLGERIIVRQAPYSGREDIWAPFAHVLRSLVDFARYLEPEYATAVHLRRRMADLLPRSVGFLARLPRLPVPVVRLLQRAFALLERAVPPDPELSDLIASVGPDVVLVSPLVTHASPQTDIVKSAKALGLPTGLLVGSWDHLTSKGLVRIKPDRLFVWNDIQKREAVGLHGIDETTVVVTGAQPFDKWFDRQPTVSREAFCRKVGLPSERPYILFVGSTATISRPEEELGFVRRWVASLRGSRHEAVRNSPILIRPHPFNSEHWADVRFDDWPDVAVYPREPANPVNDADREDYFHSMHFSTAIVGINTSAMVEATILGRPVLTILGEAFAGTQKGTLHFRYLLPENGGFLEVAKTVEEHVGQLERVLDQPEIQAQRLSDFVATFVRPNGRAVDATTRLVEEIERMGTLGPRPAVGVPKWLRPVSSLIASGLAARSRRRTAVTAKRGARTS